MRRPAAEVWVLLGGLTLLAAVLRLVRLGHGGLWYDELIMARLTTGPWAALWADIWHGGRPPLYPILGWAASHLLGPGDAAQRLLSAGLGIATVPLLFFTARRLLGTRAGLVAAGLLAVCPYAIYYSQEHRYYALLLLLGTWSIGWLLRAWRFGEPATTQIRPRRWGSWLAYILASVAMFYTHPMSALLLLSLGLAGLGLGVSRAITWRQCRAFLLSQVVIVLLMMLWGLFPWVNGAPLLGEEDADMAQATGAAAAAVGGVGGGTESGAPAAGADGTAAGLLPGEVNEEVPVMLPWIQTPPWWGPIRTWLNFLLLGKRYVDLTWAAAGAVVLLVGVGVMGLRIVRGRGTPGAEALPGTGSAGAKERRGAGRRGRARSWWLAAWWALGPVLALAAGAWWWQPIYVDRYVIPAAAGLITLVAGLLVRLSGNAADPTPPPGDTRPQPTRPRPGLPLWASVGALALVMIGTTLNYYQDPRKGAWPQAVAWADSQVQPGDVLAFASERGSPQETQNVRDNWFWYAPQHRSHPAAELQVQQPTPRIARRLRAMLPAATTSAPAPAVWLVLWRDPDHPRHLDRDFDAGPVEGLRLDSVEEFFDLTLMRFTPAS